LIRSGQASPVDVLEAHLETIERINPIVNAIITLAAEQAWEAASEAEKAVSRGDDLGPLYGLPGGVQGHHRDGGTQFHLRGDSPYRQCPDRGRGGRRADARRDGRPEPAVADLGSATLGKRAHRGGAQR
jgi:hypothetical protein